MPWEYKVSTGVLSKDNVQQPYKGYSGKGVGKDRPAMEASSNIGPIPAGNYTIGASYKHPTKGPEVMKLAPVGHNAHGRTNFLIHGDSKAHPGKASEGCIVLGQSARKAIANSHDTQLVVLP